MRAEEESNVLTQHYSYSIIGSFSIKIFNEGRNKICKNNAL